MENILQESDVYSEEIDRAFSSLSELNDAIESTSEQTDERAEKTFDERAEKTFDASRRYSIGNPPNASLQNDEKSKTNQLNSSEIFDSEPINSPRQNDKKSFNIKQFNSRGVFDSGPSSSMQNDEKSTQVSQSLTSQFTSSEIFGCKPNSSKQNDEKSFPTKQFNSSGIFGNAPSSLQSDEKSNTNQLNSREIFDSETNSSKQNDEKSFNAKQLNSKEIFDSVPSSSMQNDEKSTQVGQSLTNQLKSSEIFDSEPNASKQNDDEPKGQSFDVSQFSICEIFDHLPGSSRPAKPYDFDRFSERPSGSFTLQDDEALHFDNEQFYVNELSDEDGRLFDVHRYSISEILEGAPDSKKPIADVRFRKMEEELSNLLKQCFEKDEYIRSLTRRLKDSGFKASELRKNLFIAERRNEELAKNLEEAKAKMHKAQADSAEAKARLVEVKSMSRKKAEADLERQLKQAVSQHERQKAELEGLIRSTNEKLEDARRELEAAKTENKLLSRQKSELFTVVSKQMKLVANLRRQIQHLRAGLLKDFTEEEIRKAIESRVKN